MKTESIEVDSNAKSATNAQNPSEAVEKKEAPTPDDLLRNEIVHRRKQLDDAEKALDEGRYLTAKDILAK